MRFLLTNSNIQLKIIGKIPFKISRMDVNGFSLLSDEKTGYVQNEKKISITEGYIRNFDLEPGDERNSSEYIIQDVYENWPLPNNISGSFSSVVLNKSNNEIVICNDVLGIYPLYYLQKDNSIFISNSIILMGIVSKCSFDEAGIIQRSLGPEFSNVGSRTILENCKRLLPGEWLKLDFSGVELNRKYDNSLYKNLTPNKLTSPLVKDYWEILKKEMEYCLNISKKVNIALSGGVDSRIVLGSISKKKQITSLTFGESSNYETKIAAKLAKIKGASFKNFYDLNLYFPEKQILRKYTIASEAVYLGSWLEILESFSDYRDEPIITGDLTTALTGRNIKNFSSKKQRKKNFFKHNILNSDFGFTPGNKNDFEKWKSKTRNSYLRFYGDNLLSKFRTTTTKKHLINALNYNLDELFLRIEKHNLPYVELYDELFTWYTHTRTKSAKQILICKSKFRPLAPALSQAVLCMASSIHPNLRLNLRFVNKLFQEIPDLKKYNSIPTSQVPIIPQSYPSALKFLIWGFRSSMDTYFIKRLMESKNPNNRYRLFKSINWIKVYQNPNMERNLKSYFKNNHLGDEFFNLILDQSVSRQKLEKWPLANMEALSVSALNQEIDIIKSNREGI